MANTVPSTLNAQILLDYARLYPWTAAAIGVAGYSDEPAVSFLDDIVKRVLNKANPWKWNEVLVPVFYTQPYQQDYPTSISQNVMGWLQECTMVDINNVTSQSQNVPPVQCVARLLPMWVPGFPTKISWIPNSTAITSTWPGPGITFKQPLVSLGGGPGGNPPCAITDGNGNIWVVTGYGTTGSNPVTSAANAAAGTVFNDGSVVWTVVDPNGCAFRLDRIASFGSNVYQMRPTYQQKPPNIVSLTQVITPIPDDLSYLVKQGFLAFCYKQVDNAKFQVELAQWMQDIKEALGASDREDQEFGMYPDQGIQDGGCGGDGGNGYVGWPGWTSGN